MTPTKQNRPKVRCPKCQKELDKRGLRGHMLTHEADSLFEVHKKPVENDYIQGYKNGYRDGFQDSRIKAMAA